MNEKYQSASIKKIDLSNIFHSRQNPFHAIEPEKRGDLALKSVRDTIRQEADNLTASERKLANAVMADYPYGALQTIQEMAEKTGVSAPSITRFVAKIGFAGYQEFQRQLISELRESGHSPLELKATENLGNSSVFLADYASRTAQRLVDMAEAVSQEQFDRILALLSDPSRSIYLIGGRMTDNIASFLAIHLKQIRPRVHHLPANPEHWPDTVLSMRKQDVLLMFDFRRYQPALAMLAENVAKHRKSSIVLITDKWMSPIARNSDHVVALPIEIETAWDTVVCALALVEALIVKVSESDWTATRKRLEAWDELRLARPGQFVEDSNDS